MVARPVRYRGRRKANVKLLVRSTVSRIHSPQFRVRVLLQCSRTHCPAAPDRMAISRSRTISDGRGPTRYIAHNVSGASGAESRSIGQTPEQEKGGALSRSCCNVASTRLSLRCDVPPRGKSLRLQCGEVLRQVRGRRSLKRASELLPRREPRAAHIRISPTVAHIRITGPLQ